MKYLLSLVLIVGCFLTSHAGAIINVVGEPAYDFGDFSAAEKQATVFKITNSGDETLIIKQIRKTCGCSEVTLDKYQLEPGDIGIINAGIKANSLSGGFSKSFYLISNAENRMLQRLVMTGNAVVEKGQ